MPRGGMTGGLLYDGQVPFFCGGISLQAQYPLAHKDCATLMLANGNNSILYFARAFAASIVIGKDLDMLFITGGASDL